MILIALGSNRQGPWGEPKDALDRAVAEFERYGVTVVARSQWYRSAPWGYVHQSEFVNGVISVATRLAPLPLLRLCHRIERNAGRRRGMRWGPRCLDLDLLAFNRLQVVPRRSSARANSALPLMLPHPQIRRRPFVLIPLHDVARDWTHPQTGETANQMLARLGPMARWDVFGPVSSDVHKQGQRNLPEWNLRKKHGYPVA